MTVARGAEGNPRSDVVISWISSNPSVATVDAAGVVLGVAPGEAKITGTSGTGNGTVDVQVVKSNLTGLSIEPRTSSARTSDVVRFNVRANSGRASNEARRWTVRVPAATTDPHR